MDADIVKNKSLQEDEIQAMFSIYESEWQVEDPIKKNSYSMKISTSSGNSVFFKVLLPEDYPLNSPPKYEISAPWMSRVVKNRLAAKLEYIYSENIGSCVLYQWVAEIQDFINGELAKDNGCDDSKNLVYHDDANTNSVPIYSACELLDNLDLPCSDEELPPIIHGEIVEDNENVFQGHVARVVSTDQARNILKKLKENSQIAIAAHNIFACQIRIGGCVFIIDSDDDGELGAGRRLLDVLQTLGVRDDVAVIVSRWYGNSHQGPDTVKDIRIAARNALLAAGFIQEKTKGSGKKYPKD